MNGNTYDVVIIGGGVIGSSIARALSKYECRTVLLEKEEDVCSGTSKANSAIVHAGYDAKTGSLKAKLNVKGNAMMGDLSKELDFDFKRNSSLVLCFAEEDRPALQALYERGVANGVPDISILTGDEVRKMEPNVSGEVVAALLAPIQQDLGNKAVGAGKKAPGQGLTIQFHRKTSKWISFTIAQGRKKGKGRKNFSVLRKKPLDFYRRMCIIIYAV